MRKLPPTGTAVDTGVEGSVGDAPAA